MKTIRLSGLLDGARDEIVYLEAQPTEENKRFLDAIQTGFRCRDHNFAKAITEERVQKDGNDLYIIATVDEWAEAFLGSYTEDYFVKSLRIFVEEEPQSEAFFDALYSYNNKSQLIVNTEKTFFTPFYHPEVKRFYSRNLSVEEINKLIPDSYLMKFKKSYFSEGFDVASSIDINGLERDEQRTSLFKNLARDDIMEFNPSRSIVKFTAQGFTKLKKQVYNKSDNVFFSMLQNKNGSTFKSIITPEQNLMWYI